MLEKIKGNFKKIVIALLGIFTLTAAAATNLPVPQGGTGASTLTGLVVGNGQSAFTTNTTGALTSDLNIDSNTLVIDHINNRVGIGKTSPAVPLDINGTFRSSKISTWGTNYVAGGNYFFGQAYSGYTLEKKPPLNDYIGNSLFYTDVEYLTLTSSGSIINAYNSFRPGDTYSTIGNTTLPIVVTLEGTLTQDTNVDAQRAFLQAHGNVSATIKVEIKKSDSTWVTLSEESINLSSKEYWFSNSFGSALSYPGDYHLKGVRYTITSLSQSNTWLRQLGIFQTNSHKYPFLKEYDPVVYGDLGINTTSPDAKLQVVGDAKIGDDNTNYAFFDTDGELTLTGTARVKNEIWVPSGGLKAPGLKPATYIAHGLDGAWQFDDQAVAANQETISGIMRIPNRMDRSVAPVFKIAWSADGVSPGDCKWQLEYLWRSANEATDGAAQETLTKVSTASSTSNGFITSEITGVDLPSATDSCFQFRITRLSADVQDTIVDTVESLGVCASFTSNKLGDPL